MQEQPNGKRAPWESMDTPIAMFSLSKRARTTARFIFCALDKWKTKFCEAGVHQIPNTRVLNRTLIIYIVTVDLPLFLHKTENYGYLFVTVNRIHHLTWKCESFTKDLKTHNPVSVPPKNLNCVLHVTTLLGSCHKDLRVSIDCALVWVGEKRFGLSASHRIDAVYGMAT